MILRVIVHAWLNAAQFTWQPLIITSHCSGYGDFFLVVFAVQRIVDGHSLFSPWAGISYGIHIYRIAGGCC